MAAEETVPPELTPAVAAVPTLVEFIRNVPPPLTVLLVQLAPHVQFVRRFAEILSWKASYSESWLVLGAWWGICLLSDPTLRYALPALLLLLPFLRPYLIPSTTPVPQAPADEQTLETTVADLSIIRSLIPNLTFDIPSSTFWAFARVVGLLYIPYLLFTYFVPLRIVIGCVGTILLTWRAPWAIVVRTTLHHSALVRRSIARVWILLSGEPTMSNNLTIQNIVQPPQAANSIRFMFTVLENQRWWVGLDWTAALFPNERPSWSSTTLQPLHPPSAFILPPPTSTYMSDGKGGVVKRTATWSWEEPVWKVVVKPDEGVVKRVERALPVGKEETATASRMDKSMRKMKEIKDLGMGLATGHRRSTSLSESSNGATGDVEHPLPGSGSSPSVNEQSEHNREDSAEDDLLTDVDGWVFGDNQWLNRSNQGGLRKYTRYRKWTRIAILQEEIEPVSAEEYRAQERLDAAGRAQRSLTESQKSLQDQDNEKRRGSIDTNEHPVPVQGTTDEDNDDTEDSKRKGLRRRLKDVVRSSTLS